MRPGFHKGRTSEISSFIRVHISFWDSVHSLCEVMPGMSMRLLQGGMTFELSRLSCSRLQSESLHGTPQTSIVFGGIVTNASR